MNERGRRQDTMVLSPPKEQEPLKNSIMQPPNHSSNSTSKSPSIFWNDEGKKKLLSMIRNIK